MTLQRLKGSFFVRVGIIFIYCGLFALFTAGFYDTWMNGLIDNTQDGQNSEYVNSTMSMAAHIPVWFLLSLSAALMGGAGLIFVCEIADSVLKKGLRLLCDRQTVQAEVNQ